MGWSVGIVALGVLGAVAMVPEGRLRCADPLVEERSPDRVWTLILCRRPTWFAMPGASGDAPGWIVLRDREGAIRGVVHLAMVQMYGATGDARPTWSAERVAVPLVAELPLTPARGPLERWIDDRIWRLRAMVGLTPRDDMFR